MQAGALTASAILTDTSLNAAAATQTIHLIATGVAANTTTTLASSVNPSAYQQSVTFTATVAPTTGTALPTGTVQFSVDGVAAGGPVTLNGSGVATLTSTTLAVGTHSITAVYTPDSTSFTASSATALSQVVSKATLGQNGLARYHIGRLAEPIERGSVGDLHSDGAGRCDGYGDLQGRGDDAGNRHDQRYYGDVHHDHACSRHTSCDGGLWRRYQLQHRHLRDNQPGGE